MIEAITTFNRHSLADYRNFLTAWLFRNCPELLGRFAVSGDGADGKEKDSGGP